MKDKKTDNQDDIEATAAIENLLAMREDVASSDTRNMTNNATINIRTDANTKNKAEKLFDSFGMSMSTAINVFLKQAVRE